MLKRTSLAAVLVAMFSLICGGANSFAGRVAVKTADGALEMDENGQLVQFQCGPFANLIHAPVQVRITDVLNARRADADLGGIEKKANGVSIAHTSAAAQLSWTEELSMDRGLRWTLTFKNTSDRRRE